MAAVTASAMPTPSEKSSIFCACCRSHARKKQAITQGPINPVLHPTTSNPLQTVQPSANGTVPKIIINGHVRERSVDGFDTFDTCRTAKSEALYITARTSRPEEADNYASMSELVRQIRNEAGLTNTPRPNEKTEDQVVTEMRIEGPPAPKMNERAIPSTLERIDEMEEGSLHSSFEIRRANSVTGEPENSSVAKSSFFGRISAVPHIVICIVSIVYLYCTSFLAAVLDKII